MVRPALIRVGAAGPAVEVVASFLGRRTYNRYDLEDAAGAAFPGYVSRRRDVAPADALSWRLTVADGEAVLAPRVGGRPLHRRPYRASTVAGSMHPPLAAAMVRLAGVEAGMVVLDPCCGAGTLLLESPGRRIGVDVSPLAVARARANGLTALAHADAGACRLPPAPWTGCSSTRRGAIRPRPWAASPPHRTGCGARSAGCCAGTAWPRRCRSAPRFRDCGSGTPCRVRVAGRTAFLVLLVR